MKVTLDIEPGLLHQLETVAKKRNISLSEVAASLFKKGVKNDTEPFHMKEEAELSDWVKGIIAVDGPIPDFDHKAEYHKHLEEKYGK
ncbi:MAG: hypothetical protein JWR67_1591 [Mucilaginibacter sp.]|nr:hypothetical protein [Mucilaginibacter sp.]